jgi:hypothetical protein
VAKTTFVDGNKALGIRGTVVTAGHANGWQNHRHDGKDENGSAPLDYAADTGAANAYAIALSPALTAQVAGMPVWFNPAAENTGAATLTINGLGAAAIRVRGADLRPGHLRAGVPACVIWMGTYFELITPCRPAGEIFWWPGSSAPAGALKMNGALLLRAAPTGYPALYAFALESGNMAASDAAWTEGQFSPGTDGTNFRLPDLRGNFIRGFDDGRGIDTGRSLGSLELATGIQQYLDITDANAPFLVSGPDSDGAWISYVDPLVNPPGSSAGNTASGVFYRQGFRTRPRNVAYLACITY